MGFYALACPYADSNNVAELIAYEFFSEHSTRSTIGILVPEC